MQDIKSKYSHCVKSVQTRSYFWSVFSCIPEKYGPETTVSELSTVYAVTKELPHHNHLYQIFE